MIFTYTKQTLWLELFSSDGASCSWTDIVVDVVLLLLKFRFIIDLHEPLSTEISALVGWTG